MIGILCISAEEFLSCEGFLYMGFSLGTCFSWVGYMISWSLMCLSWQVLEIAEHRCVVASCHIIGGFSRSLFSRDEEG